MIDAFDADVLIYAASDHPLGTGVAQLFALSNEDTVGVGSVLLLPELLARPARAGHDDQVARLSALLGRLDLRPVDEALATLSVALAAKYALRTADAVHLATAVDVSADRFLTNNRRDFPTTITEIAVTYPDQL